MTNKQMESDVDPLPQQEKRQPKANRNNGSISGDVEGLEMKATVVD